jgi:AsmA protein
MRALKVAAIVLAGVVGVFVIAAVALVALFDPNDYKGVAASYVQQRTGRTLTVDEELNLSFFPWLALEAGGITVGNAPGFGDEPFARIASVSARVKLLPLLGGAVEVGGIDIDGIELNLARDAELRGNWEDLARLANNAPAGDEAGAGQETEGGDAALGGLDVAGIGIENGTVNWRENRTDLRFVLSELEFESGAIRRGAPTDVELGFHLLDAASQVTFEISSRGTVELRDEGVTTREFSAEYRVVGPDGEERTAGSGSLASFSVDGDVIELTGANALASIVTATWPEGEQFELAWESLQYDGAAQTLAVTGLETKNSAAAATWQIAGETLTDAPHLTGSVRLAADSVGNVLRLAAVELPEGVDSASLGGMELAATFDARPNDLRLGVRDIDARAFGASISGEAEIDASTLNARVAIPRFAPSDALTALISSVLPENIDARELGDVAFSGTVETNLESGRTTIRNMSAELLGGSATGGLMIAPASNGRKSVSGTLKTSRFPSNALAGLIAGYLPEKIASEVGVVAIDTRFDYDAAGDRVVVSPFAVEAFGLNAVGNATVTAASTQPRVVGDVRLAEFAPRAVLQRFDQPVPETSDPTALSSATIATRFAVDAENGSFEDLNVKLDDSTLTGSFAVANFADPSYRFDLSADRIDVDRYIPPPAEEAREGQRAAGDIGLEAEPLRAIRIEGQARVGDLKITNLRFQDVATHLAIGDGKATIDSAQAKLYGGEFNGGLFVDANGEMPTMTLRGRAAELQLTPLIEALTGDANVSGTGSFNIDLTGRGPTITDNLRSAAGSMGFALRDGTLEGFNLGQVLCLAYNKLQRLPEPPEQPKVTQYQLIQADATVANGVATSPELLARTAFVDLTGSGTLVLADGILDYGMRATMTNPIAIPNCSSMDRLIGGSIPFTIKGPATGPVILPDFGQILQERVRDELQDRLLDRLRERLQ